MSEEVKFGQQFEKKKKKRKEYGKTLFLPKKEGESVVVRFVGKQYLMYQVWNPANKTFKCYRDKRDDANARVVSFVVDREDESIKSFICHQYVFSQLGDHGDNAASHDFKIIRHGRGLQTRYNAESLGETSVSDEVLKKVAITSEHYPILDIFVDNVKWEVLSEPLESVGNRFDILDFS